MVTGSIYILPFGSAGLCENHNKDPQLRQFQIERHLFPPVVPRVAAFCGPPFQSWLPLCHSPRVELLNTTHEK